MAPSSRRVVALHFLAGVGAFASAQAALFMSAGQSMRPTIDGSGWFLNSGTGVAVMAAVLSGASLAVGRALPASLWQRWAAFAGGGAVALVATLFLIGPGTIFPIVIVVGTAIVGLATLAGAAVAHLLR